MHEIDPNEHLFEQKIKRIQLRKLVPVGARQVTKTVCFITHNKQSMSITCPKIAFDDIVA